MDVSNAHRLAGIIGILAIAALRCLIIFTPVVAFDVDPAFDATPLLGLGPAGSMLLDVLLLLACALALLGESLAGRRIDWLLMLLALIPLPVILWHGWNDAGDLWRGSTWLAAAIAAATLAHLARERRLRITIIAILLAVVAPVLARGMVQATIEHANTVAYYEEHREQFLRERGWEPDSPAAQIYERRLRQPQPLGWFATTNIFASLAAFGLVMCAGLAIAAARARMQSGWPAAMALAALIAAVGLWLTGSKGAMLATLIALTLLIVLLIPAAASRPLRIIADFGRRHAGRIVMALVVLTLLGVAIRGTLLPEGFAGERSLLFRWHYVIGSARVFAEQPLLGVGPDGFQAAYMLHRSPRSPEEVTSPHSMFLDWLTMLGLSGAAWMALVIVLLWRAGTGTEHATQEASRDRPLLRSFAPATAFIIALAFIPAMIIEWPAVDEVGLIVRLLGIGGFVTMAVLAAVIMQRDDHAARLVLLAAVAALVMHGQIEMTFTQPGAAVWSMAVLGVIGAAHDPDVRGRRMSLLPLLLAILLGAAVIITARGVIPALQQQRLMLEAAEALRPLSDPRAEAPEIIRRRQAASEMLVRAYEHWPLNVHPLEAAALQLELAAEREPAAAAALLLEARDHIDEAIRRHDKSSSVAIKSGIHARLAMTTRDAEHWEPAIAAARELARRDPHGIGAWRRLGDLLTLAGRPDEAAQAYRRALANDRNFELDPLKRLPERERQRLERLTSDN